MVYYIGSIPVGHDDYICHYGLKGMKWGVRRWQFNDGRFNEEGKRRYFGYSGEQNTKSDKKNSTTSLRKPSDSSSRNASRSITNKSSNTINKSTDSHRKTDISTKVTRSQNKNKPSTSTNDESFWTEDRKEIAKKVGLAVGVAVAGAVAYTAIRPYIIEGEGLINGQTTRYATVLSKTPIDKLSDDDTVLKTGTEVQRVIRDYGNVNKAIDMDSAKDFVYGATNEEDKKFYRTLFRSVGKGRNAITTREVVSDINMPSARKRVQTFMNGFNDQEFTDAFVYDMRKIGGNKKFSKAMLDKMSPKEKQSLYSNFFWFAGNSESKSAKLYFQQIREMGYTALSDDNDGGYITNTPTIFLNASHDTVVKGHRYASGMEKMMETMQLKHILGSLSSTRH